ncbi:MAG: transposase [Chloroflexi bacterium]|nr:transposase [Chloroflexota bacterium]
MPRKPRLDAPGLLCHIISRGIDGRELFADSKDRWFFLERLGEILLETETPVYAFALIPNHFHLLLRRDKTEIASVMRRLLTGYAVRYNRRHKRYGHLFQNRYKAIVCQDEPYFLELVRDIHLNPIRAGLISSVEALGTHPFAGHSYIMGRTKSEWFKPDAVLSHFGRSEKRARNAYLEFLKDGLSMGKRPELTGGGLKRSLGYPRNYPKTKQAFDDRILGEGGFVESILALSDPPTNEKVSDTDTLLAYISQDFGISEALILGRSRSALVSKARAHFAYRMSSDMGLSATQVARTLSISVPGALKAIARGSFQLERKVR